MKKGIIVFVVVLISMISPFVYLHEKTKDGISIVGYHGVVEDVEKETLYKNNHYYISKTEFEKHMKYLYDHQYQALSLEEVEQYYNKEIEVSKKCVALTFDDGHKNFNDIVKPILEKYKLKGTCFVIGKHVVDQNSYYLKKEDLMNTGFVEYYSHSYDLHRKAKGFNKKVIETMTLKEIEEDFKQGIVNHRYFAYPFGRSVKGIENVLQSQGVHLAFSYNQFIHMTRDDHRYHLPRYMIMDIMNEHYIYYIYE